MSVNPNPKILATIGQGAGEQPLKVAQFTIGGIDQLRLSRGEDKVDVRLSTLNQLIEELTWAQQYNGTSSTTENNPEQLAFDI